MSGEGGLAFLLDLAETATFRDGDGLTLEDGRIVAVKAAAEPLAEIKATAPTILSASPGTSAIAICRPSSPAIGCSSAATTSSRRC